MLASFTTALTTLALVASAPHAPHWESDYGKALEQTRADEQPLLIVLDKPAAEKEQLDPALLGEEQAGLLGAYDLCRVDVTTEYGQKVAKAFGAKQFPYVAIIDKQGKVIIHSQTGEVTAAAWKSTLAKYQSGQRVVRHTVAKPVIVDSTSEGVFIESSPAQSTPVYHSPSPNYYNPPADCPNCRRGY